MSHKIGYRNLEKVPRQPITVCGGCGHRRYRQTEPKCNCHFPLIGELSKPTVYPHPDMAGKYPGHTASEYQARKTERRLAQANAKP
jgi:hypothetical protein